MVIKCIVGIGNSIDVGIRNIYASIHNLIEVAKVLMRSGANPFLTDNEVRSILNYDRMR